MSLTNPQGTWVLTWTVSPDGSYKSQWTGPSPLPEELGQIGTKDGKYGYLATSGKKDAGAYQFTGPDQLALTGSKGTAIFQRATGDDVPSPGASPASFEAYWKAADSVAGAISPTFKLYRIDCFAMNNNGKPNPKPLIFKYYAPNRPGSGKNGDWVILTVSSSPGGAYKTNVNGSNELGKYRFVAPQAPFPDRLVSEQEAFRKFATQDPILPPDEIALQLVNVGAEPQVFTMADAEGSMPAHDLILGQGTVVDRDDLIGRWAWRLLVIRKFAGKTESRAGRKVVNPIGVDGSRERHQLRYIYLDAKTGEAL